MIFLFVSWPYLTLKILDLPAKSFFSYTLEIYKKTLLKENFNIYRKLERHQLVRNPVFMHTVAGAFRAELCNTGGKGETITIAIRRAFPESREKSHRGIIYFHVGNNGGSGRPGRSSNDSVRGQSCQLNFLATTRYSFPCERGRDRALSNYNMSERCLVINAT